jgi:energy-coupling factor transport system ATP-binding protein
VVLMDDGRVRLSRPPRAAWDDETPWLAAGVGIPDLVRLAHAVPDAFPGGAPLSVDEAVEAARGTWLAPALERAAASRPPAVAEPAGPPVLHWDHVTVDFGAKRAVDDVSLSVAPGEWVALIGANGSGKSTLTGLSVGLSAATRGTVSFRGQPVSAGKVFAAAQNVALLLQAADEMLFAETVLGELEFGTRFRALPPEPVLDVAGAVDFFGFRGREQDSPWELSQGGRQRLALAAILVGAPGVLVLDEPTTGQDADHMRAFLALIRRVRERTGLTVLTVTHDIRSVASRASRVVLLGEGRIRADGPTARVFAQTADLERWGVLAPPLARLQVALAPGADVLLDTESVAAAALAHRDDHAATAVRP